MKLITIFLVIALFSSCSNSYSSKFDAPLKQKLKKIDSERSDQTVQFIGQCNLDITEDMREKMENCGITVSVLTGNMFTGSGNSEALKKAAELEFITQLQLSQERNLNSK